MALVTPSSPKAYQEVTESLTALNREGQASSKKRKKKVHPSSLGFQRAENYATYFRKSLIKTESEIDRKLWVTCLKG